MTNANYNTATPTINTITKCTAIQTKAAVTGAKVSIALLDTEGNTVSNHADILAALGQTAYNNLIATALSDLNTALTSAKSDADTALAAL